MSRQFGVLAALVFAFLALSFAHPVTGAAKAAAKPGPCGAPLGGSFSEPPRVDMWTLRKDAGGRSELILGVHKDHGRFCYRYTIDGTARTVAPLIVVRRGDHFDLRIANDITTQSRGEFVASNVLPDCMPMAMPPAKVVHYPGYLNHTIDDVWMPDAALDTNIHLHGFQGPASQENVFLSTLSTPMHACEYHIDVPKSQPPGTYFYHPHAHGASDVQIAGGLAGVWIVEPDVAPVAPADDHLVLLGYRWPIQNEYLYTLDYTPLAIAGFTHEAGLKGGKPVPYDPFHPPSWPFEFPLHGGGMSLPAPCEGLASDSELSVNGHRVPATLDVSGGSDQLFRIVNGTSDSPKLLELHDENGEKVPMRVAEIDANPLSGDFEHPLARYLSVDKLMVSSANRTDVLIDVPPGRTYTLWSEHYCPGAISTLQYPHALLRIGGTTETQRDRAPAVASQPVDAADTPAAKLVAFARAHQSLVRKRAITFTEYFFPPHKKIPPHASFFVTDTTNPDFREHSYYPQFAAGQKVPQRADIVVKRGSIEEWYLINTTMESHTFHIHQMSFVQIDGGPNGVPVTIDDMWDPVGTFLPNPKDPKYPLVKPSIVRVLMDFRNVPRGTFVFHCHMLFHEDHGMMGVIRVV